LPDVIRYERSGFSPDTISILEKRGHKTAPTTAQGVAEMIVFEQNKNRLEAGFDRRAPDGAAVAE
jgi:gamma-glutamyltranspeptidase